MFMGTFRPLRFVTCFNRVTSSGAAAVGFLGVEDVFDEKPWFIAISLQKMVCFGFCFGELVFFCLFLGIISNCGIFFCWDFCVFVGVLQ